MKTALFGLAASAAALAFALPATAATTTLEVVAAPLPAVQRGGLIAYWGPLGQSFTAFSDTLTSVEFQFATFNASSPNSAVNLSLYAGETLSGSALYNTSFVLPAAMAAPTWFQIGLPDLAVAQGEKYTFVLSTTSYRNGVYLGPSFTYSDPAYPSGRTVGGDAYAGGKFLSTNATYPNCAGAANNCDLNFRLTGETFAVAVPEPATWGLMILGFGVIGGALRSSRRTRAQLNFA